MGLIGPCFARAQTWLQAGKYINALVSGLPCTCPACGRRRATRWPGHGSGSRPKLAIGVLTGAYGDDLRFGFVCGDEVYGACTALREFLEDRGQA